MQQMMVKVFGYKDAFHLKYGECDANMMSNVMISNMSRDFEMEKDPGNIN